MDLRDENEIPFLESGFSILKDGRSAVVHFGRWLDGLPAALWVRFWTDEEIKQKIDTLFHTALDNRSCAEIAEQLRKAVVKKVLWTTPEDGTPYYICSRQLMQRIMPNLMWRLIGMESPTAIEKREKV